MKNFQLPEKKNINVTNIDDPLEYYYRFISGYFYRQRIENCLSLIPGRTYSRILEIGTGSGVTLPSLLKFAGNVHAFDIHDKLPNVRTMLKLEGVSEHSYVYRADINSIPVTNEIFDIVIVISILEHFDNFQKIVDEIYRIISMDGILIIGVPAHSKLMKFLFKLLRISIDEYHLSEPQTIIKAFQNKFSVKQHKHLKLFYHGPVLYHSLMMSKLPA